ncbi:uncharacterized protein G2W53_035178 [Senna tora]|uniref:Retrotransposon gag domain-containing protein n=1 Tax=Senna tora TaxID=362788 RepID=A0A834SPT7_9FABA|nr:uncharacterized protein G2W53_035178 [Senna tora]
MTRTTRGKEFYFDSESEKTSKKLRKEAKAVKRALDSTTLIEGSERSTGTTSPIVGLANEDPYNHLKEFHVVCSSMKPDRITEDQIKLRAFPFFLEDAAKKWLFYLLASSITSWEQMMKNFLERYYPASRVNNVRRELFEIKQHTHETLFDYWERFKELCASCPQHGIPEQALISFFYEDEQVTFKMFNSTESPKGNEKCCKIEAAKEGVSKTVVDGDLNNHQIDPGEKAQKYLTEIEATDQFGGPTMLKAPPWSNKAKSPHYIN